MPHAYQRADMRVREASNNINRNIVQEDYCDYEELETGMLFEWHTKGNDWLFATEYCDLGEWL